MSAKDEIHRLETELELSKQDLREDADRINQKFQETRAQLSPTNLVEHNALLFCGLALLLGFVLGSLGVPVKKIGKPAARAMLKPLASGLPHAHSAESDRRRNRRTCHPAPSEGSMPSDVWV